MMGFVNFLSRLFGMQSAQSPAPDPAHQRAAANQGSAPARTAVAEAILNREEVFDSNNRLCGFRFGLSPFSGLPEAAEPDYLEALGAAGIPGPASERLAFIAISEAAVARGAHARLAAPNTVFVLDLRSAALPESEWWDRLQTIRDCGSRSALAGVDASTAKRSLLNTADIAIIDLAAAPALESQIKAWRAISPALRFALAGVNSWALRRQAAALGVDYCLGAFITAQDEEAKQGQLRQNQNVLIALINRLQKNAELSELGAIARQDPSIALRLIGLANSPVSGLSTPVASLEQAILFLGREQLHRLLTISMFRTGEARGKDEALLEMALGRAHFLENMAITTLSRQSRDELFLLGLLSFFDALLSLPMNSILERMPLPKRITDALLWRKGIYGRHLSLAEALHAQDNPRVIALAAALKIPLATVAAAHHAAMTWAAEALKDRQETA